MTQTEKLFLCALYALYLYESTFWAAAGEQLWVRTGSGYTPREITQKSFTLLGRMPVIADLLLLRPGLIRTRLDSPAPPQKLAALDSHLGKLWALNTFCQAQLLALLVYIPALVLTHRLTRMWPVALTIVVVIHLGIVILTALALRGQKKRWSVLGSIVVNPMGATRVLDPIAQTLWDATQPPKKSRRS